MIASARKAMGFLKMFGADRLVIFSPSRPASSGEAAFQTMCECYNQLGETAGEMGFPAGLHNHLNQMVQVEPEVDRCTAMTDPKLFSFAPDTAHLHLAGMDVPKVIARYKSRLMLLDYKDAKRDGATFKEQIFDLGDGERSIFRRATEFSNPSVDLDVARQGPAPATNAAGPTWSTNLTV